MIRRSIAAALCMTACSSTPPPPASPPPAAPLSQASADSPTVTALTPTRREEIVESLHGLSIADPYRWLEDVKNEEVKSWMAGRDRYARNELAKMPGRDAYAAKVHDLVYVESRTAPLKRGKRLFWSKKSVSQEKAVHVWQEGEAGEPKVLLDPNTMSSDGSISVSEVRPSEDGKLVAYLERSNNADEGTLKVMEVDTGNPRAIDTIPGLRYTSPSWAPDGSGFYYTWIPNDPAIPTNERVGYAEVRYHAIGTDPKTDPVLREKTGDPTRFQGAFVSKDGKYLVLTISHGWSEQDVYFLGLKGGRPPKSVKAGDWKAIAVGKKALFSVVPYKDRFYVATNENAPRFRAFVVDPKKLDQKSWKPLIDQDPVAVLDSLDVVGGHLAVAYLRNATTELEVRTLGGKLVRKVALPTLGTASPLLGNDDDDIAYFTFSSFVHPEEIHRTSIKTGKTDLLARIAAPVTPDDFEVEQHRYPSKDGTPVSIFLVHKKGLEKNGEAKTLLYGYGGFNISLTPSFSALTYPFVAEGGIYAVANLRGGGEYGEDWHRAGMLENKQNVFDDFIAAAEWLVKEKYTRPGRLAIRGGSNGGLLVGAAMTQRPELYSAVICAVPLLDMVRYHQFGIGTAWVPEYGSAADPSQIKILAGYSPYHRVQSGTGYPALLMLSADSDDRVDPLHARKFVAAVESASSSGRLNLLRIEVNAGHGGADLRKQAVEQAADQLAFLSQELSR